MPSGLIEIAREVYDTLLCGNSAEHLLEKLYEQVLEHRGPPDNVACFTVHPEDVAARGFYISELTDKLEIEEWEVTEPHIIEYARGELTSWIERGHEDDTSVHWEVIEVAPAKSLYLFALVHIDGHTPVVNWQGAYTEVSAFHSELVESGYITSEEDVNALSDEYLLELWNKYSAS